ncbi:hypothetical protein F5B22DRAFT_645411 [Xylaria bambusicola]|uniref:uncharacterized protein n=1 Tax=Xylaria bambusicola TaxID=326684 RepID=UPI002007D24A|nr:uncharacterized protein F5B22DRAFT_645411 [Xylaria bambusicola]KAI0517703.1 hypothetical protein F5B22DRAFT_645411 [Xylaria bambusicola]
MSHLAPQAAIFSPSIARAAASTAKDWAYVDAWLRRQWTHLSKAAAASLSSTSPPSFERNPETLEVLLSLIAANEEADEERHRLARLESAALDEVRAAEQEKDSRRRRQSSDNASSSGAVVPIHGDLLAEDLLQALDAGLSKDGQTALDALADVSLCLNAAADPSSSNLCRVFVDLQGAAHETSHLLHRVGLLQAYLDDESARLQAFLEDLRHGPQYQLPAAAAAAADSDALPHAVEDMAARLPELRRCVEALEKKVAIPALTVEEVRLDEEAYLDLLVKKKDLDAQVKAFAGLPPDIEAARVELENLRTQLREATERRDANFEMLVERESPVKVRASRRI